MSRNIHTGRGGKSRLVGPINEGSNKSDVTAGRGVSNDYKRAGIVDEGLDKFLKVSTPIFNPTSGPTATDFTITLTNQEAGATYKYTIDGSSPTGNAALTLQAVTLDLSLTGTTSPSLTFKSYGVRNDYADSEIITLDYVLQSVQDPVFSPPTGNVPENQLISLGIEVGATGYYTLDGAIPSGNANTTSSLYTSPFVVNFGNNADITGKAISVKMDSSDSQITTAIWAHDSTLNYGGPYDGVRDDAGKLVTFQPTRERVPLPSKVFLSTTAEEEIERKISFWGTDAFVENGKPTVKNDFILLKAGQNHALALTQSGTVVAWGDNSLGQTDLSSDSRLTVGDQIIDIDAGDSHSLALTSNQEIIAWGSDAQGQTTVPNNLNAIRVAAGGEHCLALKSDRTVAGWGENADGQLNFPSNLNDVVEISAGENFSAALIGYGVKTCKQLEKIGDQWLIVDKSIPVGKVVSWGVNDLNQSTVAASLSDGSPDVIAISCGGNHSLALDVNGKVFGWGDGTHNQTPPAQGMSLAEPDGTNAYIIKVDAGFGHSLALSERGTVFAWGSNQNNQINITNLLSNSALIAGGDNYSLAYGLEPDEHIYYNTGALDPSILYTGVIDITSDTTINAISQNKSSQAASNLTSKIYTQQKLSGVDEFGLLSSKGTYSPIEEGTVNPARFTPAKDFAVKINDDDVQIEPAVQFTVSHPGYLSYQAEPAAISDATEKRFSSILIDGDVDKAFDGNKDIYNYLSFNPGGHVGYKFDGPQKVTKVDFATNADNFHKVGDGVIQGTNNGTDWEDVAFFSKRFPNSYPPFVSLDGLALDRIASLEMISGGAGYTEDPVIVFQVAAGEEGEDAKGKALWNTFSLTGFSVLNQGTGYTTTPIVSTTSVLGGAGAAGTAVLTADSVVHGINLTHAGNGYTSTPTVNITGGGGQGAAAIVHLEPTELTGIEIIENNVPYRTPPIVGFLGGGGDGAEAVAHLTAFTVGQLNQTGLLIGMADYKPPYGFHIYDGVGIPGIGSPNIGSFGGGGYYGGGSSLDTPTGVFNLDHFDIDDIGEGYTAAPNVSLSGGTLTNTGQAYAVIFSDGHRGPTSGQFIRSHTDQGFNYPFTIQLPDTTDVRGSEILDLETTQNKTYHASWVFKGTTEQKYKYGEQFPYITGNSTNGPADALWMGSETSPGGTTVVTSHTDVHPGITQYFDSDFQSRLFSGWDAALSSRVFFDMHSYKAHTEALNYNVNTPFSGILEAGIPNYSASVAGGQMSNTLYTQASEHSRLYRIKFHKDSAKEQNIEITGGGGINMSGHVELRNHNELLGFSDDDTLLDKLICLNTHPDHLNGANVSAHHIHNMTYEELLWSTPINKGGLLPDDDATLIPYKLHITDLGQDYSSAPTITEEFDRSFPGMMYYLEPTGLTIQTGYASNNTANGHGDTAFHVGGQYATTSPGGRSELTSLNWGIDPDANGWTRLWGSGWDVASSTVHGGFSSPQGSCASSLTGIYYQDGGSYPNYIGSSGHYLSNKYLSTDSSKRFKIPFATYNPEKVNDDHHPYWNKHRVSGVTATCAGTCSQEQYVHGEPVWFSGTNTSPSHIAVGEVLKSFPGPYVAGIEVTDGGLGYVQNEIALVYGPPNVNNHAGFRSDNVTGVAGNGHELRANQPSLRFVVGAGVADRNPAPVVQVTDVEFSIVSGPSETFTITIDGGEGSDSVTATQAVHGNNATALAVFMADVINQNFRYSISSKLTASVAGSSTNAIVRLTGNTSAESFTVSASTGCWPVAAGCGGTIQVTTINSTPLTTPMINQKVRLRSLPLAQGSSPDDNNIMYGTVDRHHRVDQIAGAQISTVEIAGGSQGDNYSITIDSFTFTYQWTTSNNSLAFVLAQAINSSQASVFASVIVAGGSEPQNHVKITADVAGTPFTISTTVNGGGTALIDNTVGGEHQANAYPEVAGTLVVDIGSTVGQSTAGGGYYGGGASYEATSSTEWSPYYEIRDYIMYDDGNSIGWVSSPLYGNYCIWAWRAANNVPYAGGGGAVYQFRGNGSNYISVETITDGLLDELAIVEGNGLAPVWSRQGIEILDRSDTSAGKFTLRSSNMRGSSFGGSCWIGNSALGGSPGYGYTYHFGNHQYCGSIQQVNCHSQGLANYIPSNGDPSLVVYANGGRERGDNAGANTLGARQKIVLDNPGNLDTALYSAGKFFLLRPVSPTTTYGAIKCEILSFDSSSGALEFTFGGDGTNSPVIISAGNHSASFPSLWHIDGWTLSPLIENWTVEVAYGDKPYLGSTDPDTISYEPNGNWIEPISPTISLGDYSAHHHERPWEQLEFYAPKLEATKMHTNDMYSASSTQRENFEDQLAKWVSFEPLMSEHSIVEAFLASGSLESIEMTNFGDGYTSVPDVNFTGGLEIGAAGAIVATGEALTSQGVESITLTNGGSNYKAFPDITITGGGGADAFAVGQKSASDITGVLLVDGGKNYTESPTMIINGGGDGITSLAALKCRLPVALGTLAFANNKPYKEYRMVGQGDNVLKTSQVNELDFYSGDYRISNYSNRNDHTLAIKSDTSLLGWGDNTYGQLPSSGITNAISVSAGDQHSLIVKENGTVVAFGDNTYGQINVPDDLSNVIDISAGSEHSLALLAGGMVRAWGQNISGQCNVPESLQEGLTGRHGAIAVKASNHHSLALLGNGTVTGWGAALPATVPNDLDRINRIAAGESFSLALKDNGDVVSWGGVDNVTYGHIVPTDLKDVVTIDACNDHVLALQVDGTVTGWGRIFDGQNHVNISDVLPENLSGINIFAGKNHGSVLMADGSMVTFGDICGNEVYNQGVVPTNITTTCCGITGSVIYDLGQTNNNELNTSEKIAYRSANITNRLGDDAYFPPEGVYQGSALQNKVRIVAMVTGVGYINSDPVTGEYPLIELAPVVSPETNVNYGPSVTVPNWDQESVGDLHVRYTLDGTSPSTGNGVINEVDLIPENGDFYYAIPAANFTNSTTLKVFAFSDVYLNSDDISYTRQQLSAPTVNIVANGNILDITMSSAVPAGETREPTIYYTLDGTTPTTNSYAYSSAVSLQASTVTAKAKSFLVGYIDSNITTETHP